LKEQIPDTSIHSEMLGYQSKQTFIIYWTMSRKPPSEHNKPKMTEKNSFTFFKFNN